MLTKVPSTRGDFNWKANLDSDGTLGTTPLEIHNSDGDLYAFTISIVLGPQTFQGELICDSTFIGQLKFAGSIDCFGGRKMNCQRELRISPTTFTRNEGSNNVCTFAFNGGIEGTAAKVYEAKIRLVMEIRPLLNKPVSRLPRIASAIEKLFLDEQTSDIKIICDGEEFPSHQFMLSLRSDVFRAMFSIDSKEKQEKIIQINDIPAPTMKSFLKFVYTDSLEGEEINCDLLKAADKYNFRRLVDICQKHLLKIMSTENVMEILVTSYLLNYEALLKEVSKFIFNNRGSVWKGEQWDDIKKKHPGMATKVMDLMIFREDK